MNFNKNYDTQLADIVQEVQNFKDGNGQPKGVYSTLVDLQNAKPTGDTGVYVITADGHWYYWNGSAWTNGGTYQSTSIATGSIDEIKLNDAIRNDTIFLNGEDPKYIDLTSSLFDSTIGTPSNGKLYIQNIPITRRGKVVINAKIKTATTGKIVVLNKVSETSFTVSASQDVNFVVGVNHIESDLTVTGSGTEYIGLVTHNEFLFKLETSVYGYYQGNTTTPDLSNNASVVVSKATNATLGFYAGVKSKNISVLATELSDYFSPSVKLANIITVAKTGGDYSTIAEAVNNANDSEISPVTILLYPGVYEESVYIGPTRHISIVGYNKLDTIILDKSGAHLGGFGFEGTGYCKNIQFIQTGENWATYPDLTGAYGYALHIDNTSVESLGGNSYFEDCIFRTSVTSAVGIGVQQDQTIKFKNCEFYTTRSTEYAIYAHSSNRKAGVTGQNLILENCYLHSVGGKVIKIEDLGSGAQEMNVTFINNMAYSDVNGKLDTTIVTTTLTTGNFSGTINLTGMSYGNNVAKLNA